MQRHRNPSPKSDLERRLGRRLARRGAGRRPSTVATDQGTLLWVEWGADNRVPGFNVGILGRRMDRERAWVIPAILGVTLLITFFFSLGGVAGIARQPVVSGMVLAIILVVGAPILWFTYRSFRRDPTITPVEFTPADVFGPPARDGAPMEFVGSTWKALAWAIYLAAVFSLFLNFSFREPGVCRAASLTFVVPFALWSIATLFACVVRPERLTIAQDGLTHVWLWRSRHWTWDEVRDIRMVKQNIPFVGRFLKRRPVASIYFKRYQPPGRAGGRARVSFRSIYKVNGYELASALESARAEWLTPAGESFIPVPRTWRSYFPTAIVLVVVGALMWIWYAHPCGR